MVLIFAVAAIRALFGSGEAPGQTEKAILQSFPEGSRILVCGTVRMCRTLSYGERLFLDHVTVSDENGLEFSFCPDEMLTFTTGAGEAGYGDELRVQGELALFSSASNPGQFDAKAYYFEQNTICELKRAKILARQKGKMQVYGLLDALQERIADSYREILDPKTAATIAAISLGEKGKMEQEWKDLYQEGGIAHILAISGLHVTLIGMSFYRLLRRGRFSFGQSAAVSGTVVVLYVLMTGFGISSVRAALMFLIWLGAQACGRKYDAVTAIACAALLITVKDDHALYQASFLLSFAAVLSLAVLLPCLEAVLPITGEQRSSVAAQSPEELKLRNPVWKRARPAAVSAARMLLASVAVWLGTLPVTLYFFYQAAPWSILVNLAVLPLMSAVMACGLTAATAGMLSVPAGIFFAAPVYYLLQFFEWLCSLQQKLPCAVWVAGRPSLGRIAGYYGALAAAMYVTRHISRTGFGKVHQPESRLQTRFRRDLSVSVWLAGVILGVFLMAPARPAEMTVTCLDVGQGDSALLRFPGGETILIDGGSSSKSDVWRYRISCALKYYGVQTLDYVFLSHADYDHISGITEYLEEYEPGFANGNSHGITLQYLVLPPTADPEDFAGLKKTAGEKGIRVLSMERGAAVGGTDGRQSWDISCLAPDGEGLSGDRNEDSMVLMLRYGSFRMLFTGDLEDGGEDALVRVYGGAVSQEAEKAGVEPWQQADEDGKETVLRADVLKVGHHGSKNGSSGRFLAEVSPELAVISCGADNSYGHPAEETLERLRQNGCQVFQTPQCGAVTIRTNGEQFSVGIYRKY